MVRTTRWWLGLAAAAALAVPKQAHAALTSYWNFNDVAPVTSDSGPANIDLQLLYGATYQYLAPAQYALSLDGVTAYAYRYTGSPLALPYGSAARTVAAWIRPANASAGTIVAWGDNPYGSGAEFQLMFSDVGGTTYLYSDGLDAANNIAILSSNVPPAGAWSHVVFTFDPTVPPAGVWRYFLNGDERQSGIVNIDTAVPDLLTVGVRSDTTSSANAMIYAGLIDELRIYDTALTPADVAALYDPIAPEVHGTHATLPPSPAGAVALTAMPTDKAVAPYGAHTAIVSAEYQVRCAGAWAAMAATDGGFDETTEDVAATVAAPAGGWLAGDTLCVRATDAAGNVSLAATVSLNPETQKPVVSVLNVENPVALGTEMTLNVTATDVGHGGSFIGGAVYFIDESLATPLTALTALDSATEAFRAFPVMNVVGSHQVCVAAFDAWGNASPMSCTTVKVYGQYAQINGSYKPSAKKAPELSYSGFVALAGTEILGSVQVTYKRSTLKTTCTFTPGAGSLVVVDGDYALLMGWTRTCSNGETGASSDLLLTDATGTTYPPANGIRLDDNVADKYDIGSPGVPLPLTNGSVDVADLAP